MTTTLVIYRAKSGQWAGKFIQDGEELGRVAGCESAEDVEDAAHEAGIEFDTVEHEGREADMQPDIAKTRQAAAAGLLALARKEITTGEAKELARQLNVETKKLHASMKGKSK